MRFHCITIFPDMLTSYLNESILKKAQDQGLISVFTYSLREYTSDKHRRVDGRPYGGGPGMVMWVDPLVKAVLQAKQSANQRAALEGKKAKVKVIIFSPGGDEFTNSIAKKTSKSYTDIIFICGRYEGQDARVKKIFQATEWTIGSYVLTGGELPAMVCIDVISRQIKGVLHREDSLEESRTASHEIYARPEVYEYNNKKYRVPAVLLSGNHAKIDEYRKLKENNISKK